MSPDKPFNPTLAFGCGCTMFWFTMTDMVDGLRARRTGCGSPLGRLIDEGGDILVMTAYSMMVGYCVMFDNTILELILMYLPVAVFGIELKTILFPGQIDMIIAGGWISMVEIEILLACICWSTAYFGPEWLQLSLGQSFGFAAKDMTYFGSIADWRVAFLFGIFISILFIMYMDDGLGECLRKNW